MRITYLADIRFPLDRANGIQTIETCYALAERGHEVRLVVRPDTVRPPRDPFAFYGLAPHPAVRIDRVRVAGPQAARRAAYVAQALAAVARARGHADVVMTRDLSVASLALRLPRATRPPIVYESHGLAPVFAATRGELLSGAAPEPPAKIRRLAARDARVWRLADGYVTITAGLARDLVERFGARTETAVVPDGVRLDPDRRFALPERPGPPVVAYAGHLYPWKGVDILLHALALVPGAHGVVVGGHPAEIDLARLRALAASLGVDARVRFTGFLPRSAVPAELDRADVLAMPHTATPVSERYASPLKLFEYMAAGRPIVASDLAAVREVLRDGENACLVKAGDPAALAAGLARVIGDRAFAERIARGAFNEAPAYTWARRAERLERVLAAAAAGA
ncbi:MAG TPA: glycosyltransferase family 4 protein [Vicinamibacterales bacterium]|nr:glycosyltransferase family 4 protein [Vicinamibacterales bacterium]